MLLLFLLFPFIILKCFKGILSFYLKNKYGQLFAGILSGGDTYWGIEGSPKNIINIALFFESKSDDDNFIENLKQYGIRRFTENVKLFPKLSCVCRNFMGYTYLLKNEVNFTEFISVIDNGKILSRADLENEINRYCNRLLPKNNTALWEAIFFSRPLEKSNQFVLLMRLSHIIGDGLSISTILLSMFGKTNTEIKHYLRENLKNILPSRATEQNKDKLKRFLHLIHIILIIPFVLIVQSYFRISDVNSLRRSSLVGQKQVVFTFEETERLVPLVKKMKKVLPKVSFTEIILTAISKSLFNHFEKVRNLIFFLIIKSQQNSSCKLKL